MQTLRNFWWLAKPFWFSEQKKSARLLLTGAIAANLLMVVISILNNYWNLYFYNSLQEKNFDSFLLGCLMFIGLQVSITASTIIAFHFQQKLIVIWRRWATENMLQHWLEKKHFLRLQISTLEMDNPDQRIADDIRMFITMSITLSLGLLTAITSLLSFLSILWQASELIYFTIDGERVTISGLLVWAAILYSLLGTGGVFWLGRKLPRLHFLQQKREADFRYSMVRLRENAEAIAMYQGEKEEHERFSLRLEKTLSNFWDLTKRQKIVLGYSTFYMRSAIMIPMIVLSPAFFSGVIPLGRLTQTSSAFEEVQTAFSFLVKSFPELAEWKSIIDRLSIFKQRLNNLPMSSELLTHHQESGFKVDNLKLWLPEGRTLISELSISLIPGDRLMILGKSGFGKSTLFRAIAGLWSCGSGNIYYNTKAFLALSQKPYLPLGSLREALYYPATPDQDDSRLNKTILQCGLEHLLPQLDEVLDWSQTLSIGEQQRCAFIRALLNKPLLLLLDESTSALDEETEYKLYHLLLQELPNSIIVSITHRATLKRFHTQTLTFHHTRWFEHSITSEHKLQTAVDSRA